MAAAGSSMLYSFLLFVATLSLQEMFRTKLASSELFTILGGFTSSLIFLMLLTFIGNYQETCGVKTGWGAVITAELVALIAASTVHRVCITTCFLFLLDCCMRLANFQEWLNLKLKGFDLKVEDLLLFSYSR